MAVSTVQAVIKGNIRDVWNTVTSLEDDAWRSDLSKVEVLNENQFVEYTTQGFATTFTVTAYEPYQRWEFDIENGNMKGHWTGVFTQKGDETELTFTENVVPKKVIMKPFVKWYLKKQQAAYVADLKKVFPG
jgi:hypothetical protein